MSNLNINGDLVLGGGTVRDFVVASYYGDSSNNYSWYRLYRSGWVEQGESSMDDWDSASFSGSTQETTKNFLIRFKDEHYTLTGVGFVIANVGRQQVNKYPEKFITGSQAKVCATSGWIACGWADPTQSNVKNLIKQ